VYVFSWADTTLLALSSFLLSLLLNSTVNRFWVMRTMVQEAINTATHIYFTLHVALEPRAATSCAAVTDERNVAVAAISRRLRLALHIMFVSARTEVAAAPQDDSDVARELDSALSSGLMTRAEATVLGRHRHAYVVLGWVLHDVHALAERGILTPMRLGDFISSLGKLRALCIDVPLFARVQLPFPIVSLVAIVVHITLLQITYIAASFIGAGVATPGLASKAFSGLFSVLFVPLVFLSILKLDALLSNPFKGSPATTFPVRSLEDQLAGMLDRIAESFTPEHFASVGCLPRMGAAAAAAKKA
jgi:hypothetical protein